MTPDATFAQSWLDESPFSQDFALATHVLDQEDAHLRLENSEPLAGYGAMHGGAVAALTSLSPQALLRAWDGTPVTVSHHVVYARAARRTGFDVRSRLIRRARELRYFETDLIDDGGREVAHASSALSVERDECRETAPSLEPPGGGSAELNTALAGIAFLTDRGLRFTGAAAGQVEITMEPATRNLDRDGTVHEGAVLGLIDPAGSSCPWTALPLEEGAHGATVALQAQMFGPMPGNALVARAHAQARGARLWWSRVEVVDTRYHQIRAAASVAYRIT